MHNLAGVLDNRTFSSTLDHSQTRKRLQDTAMTHTSAETPAVHSCRHTPACPSADAFDRDAAHVISAHPEQGWSLLCNGVVVFEDFGEILPDGHCTGSRHRDLAMASPHRRAG
jgi:hypothetical protein